ncbi:MAG: D-alanine--D-alanine ligase [Clostridia bacterium]|nr:D-alanine--D-alanine ligase [Clostridia bacterium]
MDIIVLAGGLSPERDVSLSSGAMIVNAFTDMGHRALLVDLFLGVEDVPADPKKAFENAKRLEKSTISETAPDIDAVRASRKGGASPFIGNGVKELCAAADITYIALHGGDGENGRLQAWFDMNGIRYTGSPYFGCALAMDKWVTKSLFRGAGVPTPDGKLLKKGDTDVSFPLPCVVKPCCGGSSIGISIAHTEAEYAAALADAFRYENEVLVESYVKGREFTCGCLGGKALPVTEIIPREGFYDYAHKYQAGWTEEITPARIDEATTEEIQRITELALRTLHLEVYARADFLLAEDGKLYCLEVNTLPGMTPTSLLPQGAAEAGIDYPHLCEKIVALSMEKYAQ